ncbi:MAG: AMP-binding protein, partial [Myxococcales bacterium]|nr:AMP-binding protein [Polyangiaceae bacterium]MDW8251368.1 AMP-binding protein [Myxococcales bacterium]
QHLAQIQDAAASLLFAENPLTAAQLVRMAPPCLRGVVVVDHRSVLPQPDEEGRRSLDLDELRDQSSLPIHALDEILTGHNLPAEVQRTLEERGDRLVPESHASIVYTSGTDGEPKGVLLTHGNFLFEVGALEQVFALGPDDEQLLFLPMAHVFARILEMAQLQSGYLTTFSEGSSHIFEELPEIEPTFFGAVPRFFEQFHARVLRSLSHQGLGKAAALRAVEIGMDVARRRRQGEPIPLALHLQHRILDHLFLEKLRGAFGRRLRFAFSGGAPLASSLAEWLFGLGVPLREGYGLTETTSATHVNLPGRPVPGQVGPPIPGVEVRISREQEILLRGPNVFVGYWNRPEETRRVIDEEGWFHTGDEGVMEDGHLRVVGRKKELLVTSGGHKVAPQPIEAALEQSQWIQKAVLLGEGRPFVTALLSLREETTREWARSNDYPEELDALAHSSELRAVLRAEIDALNTGLAPYEKIRDFIILEAPLTAQDGDLTPTGQLRRDHIYRRFHGQIESLYRNT